MESRSKSLRSKVLPYIQGILTASLLQLTQGHRRCLNTELELGLPKQETLPHTWAPLAQSCPTHSPLHLFQRVY